MKQTLLQEKYPVFSLDLDKSETTHQSVDEIANYFKARIEAHEAARFITIFDHYSHTMALEAGEISAEILDAKDVVFCFGISLPNPQVLAVRPRSIGICELKDSFVICFMEAPMPIANTAMESWSRALRNINEGTVCSQGETP